LFDAKFVKTILVSFVEYWILIHARISQILELKDCVTVQRVI
jgi:hypothetical protein